MQNLVNDFEPAPKRRRTVFFSSSRNDDVPTPPALLRDLHRHFNFDHDPCPLYGVENEQVPDGLSLEHAWGNRNFVNPPYSNIEPWICRGIASEKLCVFLVPARLSSAYWSKYVWPNAKKIYFLAQNVQFPGYHKPFPCPMSILVFHPRSFLDETGRPYEAPDFHTLAGIPVIPIRLDGCDVDESKDATL